MDSKNLSPLISVIVPIYKVEDYLDECVESLVKQTYKNLEIILVDDGSPDKCPQMCDAWTKRDTRIVVVHKPNGGLSDARNAGIAIAKGDYIGFVDSDDFVSPDMYEKLLNGFSLSDSVAITSIKILSYNGCGDTMPFKKKWDIAQSRTISGNEFAMMMISEQCAFTAWNKLYRKNLLENVQFRKGRNNEDTLFMYDLGKVMKEEALFLFELPYTCYYYRVRPDSICTSLKKPLAIDAIANLEEMMVDCNDYDSCLYDVLYFRYVYRLYLFCDLMLTKPIWYEKYFLIYQRKLKSVSISYIYKHFPFKDYVYIILIDFIPMFRKGIHQTKKLFK